MSAAALQFDPAEHRYTLAGRPLPSVTQILDPYTGLDYVNRDVLAEARLLGTHVHQAIHFDSMGTLEHCPERVVPYLEGWRAFLTETGAVVVASELRVYSEKYRFAGTLDVLVEWSGRTCLVDVKSGSVMPRTVGPQTAAYLLAYNELFDARLRHRYCVHLTGDGRYKAPQLTDPRDWAIFQSALNLWNWRYAA